MENLGLEPIAGQEEKRQGAQALSWLEGQQEQMEQLLENLVRLETPFSEPDRVEYLANHLDTYCNGMGLLTRRHKFKGAGPVFVAETATAGAAKPIALIGHLDTVHPVGAFGPNTFIKEGNLLKGPGVYDCKGGLVIGFFALKALAKAGYTKRPLKIVLTGDEECAHALSKGEAGQLLAKEVKDCQAVFNCESALPGGNAITRRKGGGVFEVVLQGKAAHAGKSPQLGASAIRAAAHMICAIEDLTDYEGTTFNCGKITGGAGANIIPDSCKFSIGLRYITNRDYEEALAKLKVIVDTCYVPGVTATITPKGFYPAMEPTLKTEEFFAIYSRANNSLGYPEIKAEGTGGCSDSAFATREGVPTLCGVGLEGEGAHTLQEVAYRDALISRCKRLVVAILSLPEDF